jgi:hypothetical protein
MSDIRACCCEKAEAQQDCPHLGALANLPSHGATLCLCQQKPKDANACHCLQCVDTREQYLVGGEKKLHRTTMQAITVRTLPYTQLSTQLINAFSNTSRHLLRTASVAQHLFAHYASCASGKGQGCLCILRLQADDTLRQCSRFALPNEHRHA